jgi:hypothetical protein
MMCAGFPPRLAGPARTVRERIRALTKKDKGSLTMASFSYNTAAELFPAAIRKKKRAGFAYRRFGTAAEAVRFAIEELPADSLNGAYLQVDEARFDQSGIRNLYESQDFPLPRRPRAPEPAPATDNADADAA